MCNCSTLGLCCKNTCSIENKTCKITLKVFGFIFLAVTLYFTFIGYACLFAQFVIPRGLGPNCVDAYGTIWFWFIFVFGGFFELLFTGAVFGVIIMLFVGIFALFRYCFKCCQKKYQEASVEINKHNDTNPVKLEVNVEPN